MLNLAVAIVCLVMAFINFYKNELQTGMLFLLMASMANQSNDLKEIKKKL